jgi:hypothetical protein
VSGGDDTAGTKEYHMTPHFESAMDFQPASVEGYETYMVDGGYYFVPDDHDGGEPYSHRYATREEADTAAQDWAWTEAGERADEEADKACFAEWVAANGVP